MFIDPKEIVDQLTLAGNEIVLDLGAGSGAYTLLFAKKLAVGGGRVYAVDVQQDMLTRLAHTVADEKLSNVSCVHADIEKVGGVSLRDGIGDIAVVSNTLYCTEHRHEVLVEAARLLGHGGKLLLIDWTGPHKGVGPEQGQVVDRERGLALAEEAGFEWERDLKGGTYHWAMLLKKKDASEARKHFKV